MRDICEILRLEIQLPRRLTTHESQFEHVVGDYATSVFAFEQIMFLFSTLIWFGLGFREELEAADCHGIHSIKCWVRPGMPLETRLLYYLSLYGINRIK